jgi:ferredoxin
MKVHVDSTKCQGHNRCMILAEDTFDTDDMGFAFIPEDKQEVTDDRRESVQAAARNCPEMAIVLTED